MAKNQAQIYTRLSASKGQRDEASLATQEETCRGIASRLGLLEVEIYSEGSGVSAFSGAARPELDRLWADAGPGSVVIAWELSRLLRRLTDLSRWAEFLDNGGRIVTPSLDTAQAGGRLMLVMLAAMAEEESRMKSDRVQAGKARQRAAGQYLGGHAPYGLQRDEEGRLTVEETEAEVVRRVAAEALEGTSWRQIADGLNAEDIPTRTGTRWSSTTVSRTVREDYAETVLGRPLFLRVKAARPTGKRAAAGGTHWLTGGPVLCGRCGRGLNYDRSGVGVMRCSGAARKACKGVTVSVAPLEKALGALLVSWVNAAEPEDLAAIGRRLGEAQDPAVKIEAETLAGELHEITEKIAAIGTEVAAGRIEVSMLAALTGPLADRRDQVEAALAELPEPAGDATAIVAWAADLEGPAEIAEAWLSLDEGYRREVLSVAFPEGVLVDPAAKQGQRFSLDRLRVV